MFQKIAKKNKGFTQTLSVIKQKIFWFLNIPLKVKKANLVSGFARTLSNMKEKFSKLFFKKRSIRQANLVSGFTLIELMVAVSIFAVVMVISTGSIVSVFDSNRKSQTLRTVIDNLSLTMESMTRTIRFGTNYHCDINQGAITGPRDCSGVGWSDSMSVKSSDSKQVSYRLENNRIVRTIVGVQGDYYMTSSDMQITDLRFYVFGSKEFYDGSTYDLNQPQVIIVIRGYAGSKQSSRSEFTLQTTVSQRSFDFQ